MGKKLSIFGLLLLTGIVIVGCHVQKGFQALDVYNYFAAKEHFEKSLKKDEVAASYGLSIIYLRDDNPFSNIDSSLHYIVRATTNYSTLTANQKKTYAELNADSLSIFEFREKVAQEHYRRARQQNSIPLYNQFLAKNGWSTFYDSAVYYRDELAFQQASTTGTAEAYGQFLETYKTSVFAAEAESNYDRLVYQEETATDNITDYLSFLKAHPNSPYRADAEDQIYRLYTKTGSLAAYKKFIETYPENRNVPFAWKKMFITYLQSNYSTNSIQNFLTEFKDYPFKADLEEQMASADLLLLPIKERNKWGYISADGSRYIEPQYEVAEPFYEGLAIVLLEGKYGFVNKAGDLVIDALFDDAFKMNEGHAVVEIDENWGMINRSGEFVIEPEYEDLGNLTEGLAYFLRDELYGYFDQKGIERLTPQYTAAEDFKNGKAVVSRNDYYGLIDAFGTTAIPFKFDRLREYSKGIYAANFDDYWGLINERGDTLLPFEYDYIGTMQNNRAIVEKEDAFNYITPFGNLILNEWIETFPESRQLATFQNNYARVAFEDGYNLIDTNGRKLFSQNREDVRGYSNFIAVKKNDKWGYVTPGGNLIINYNFTAAQSFENGIALAGGAPLTGVINTKGNYVIEPYFERINFINDSLAIAKSRGNYGILNAKGDTVLGFNYSSAELYTPNFVQLKTSEAVFYYQLDTGRFLRKEEE